MKSNRREIKSIKYYREDDFREYTETFIIFSFVESRKRQLLSYAVNDLSKKNNLLLAHE